MDIKIFQFRMTPDSFHVLVAIAWGGADMFIFTGGWELTPMAATSCSIGTINLIPAAVAAKLRQIME